MKNIIALFLAATSLFSAAEEKRKPIDANWRNDPEMRARVMKATERFKGKSREEIFTMLNGEYIVREGTGEGKVVFVNSQNHLEKTELDKLVHKISLMFRFRMEVVDGSSPSVESAADLAHKTGAAVVIFVTDDKALPKSLVAYEDAWGIVNLGKLENAMPEIKIERMKKLIFRTFALTAGMSDAQQVGSFMWPVKEDKDFDAVWMPTIPVPNLAIPIVKHLERLGLKQTTVATYRKACQDGWAPMPKTDNEKAIWKKVHEIPKKPMTIDFDPKEKR